MTNWWLLLTKLPIILSASRRFLQGGPSLGTVKLRECSLAPLLMFHRILPAVLLLAAGRGHSDHDDRVLGVCSVRFTAVW